MVTGVEAASLVLAIPGVIDLCIQYGDFLAQKIKAFKNAEDHARLQIFVLDLVSGGINDALTFLRDTYEELDQRFKDTLEVVVPLLQNVLIKALQAFPPDIEEGKHLKLRARAKYAVYDAKKVEEAVKDMEVWAERFVKRTDLYMKFIFDRKSNTADHALDVRNSDTVTTIDTEGESAKRLMQRLVRLKEARQQASGPIFDSSRQLLKHEMLDNSLLYKASDGDGRVDHLIEYHSYNGKDRNSVDELRLKVRNIAVRLREVDSEKMHILHCRSFSDDPVNKRFALHFDVPEAGYNPRSLRSLLADPINKAGRKHSLSDRVRLAQSIATAILYIHSCGYVHKNIRPENLIIFEPVKAENKDKFPYAIGNAYLVGYDGVRKEEDYSELNDPKTWKDKIYVPAERLCAKSDRFRFSWCHDIYSLGVILQELALWENFASTDSSTGQLLARAIDPVNGLGEVLKKQKRRVSSVLGNRYEAAVTACLSMLRKEGEALMKEERVMVKDIDGITLGTAYISEVLDNLEAINV
jgi:hypothetical protein